MALRPNFLASDFVVEFQGLSEEQGLHLAARIHVFSFNGDEVDIVVELRRGRRAEIYAMFLVERHVVVHASRNIIIAVDVHLLEGGSTRLAVIKSRIAKLVLRNVVGQSGIEGTLLARTVVLIV